MRDTLIPLLSGSTHIRRGHRLRLPLVVALAALATVAFLVPPAAVSSSEAVDEWPWDVAPGEDSDLFPLVGEIIFRDADGEPLSGAPDAVGVDPGLGLAVFIEDRQIFLVDTQTLEQTVMPDPGDDHIIDHDQAVLDTENHRLIMIGSFEGEVEGEDVHGCAFVVGPTACGAVRTKDFAVTVVDLQGHAEPATRSFELTHFGDAQVDSAADIELADPVDYHAATDNLYFATQRPDAGSESSLIGATVSRRPVLHEVSVERLMKEDLGGEAVASTWSYPLESCSKVSAQGSGALARGRQGDFVYVACEGGFGTPHGVMRVDLVTGESESDTSNFRSNFDPFVGDISVGKVSIGRGHDLVFVQIILFGPRLFVYDAHRRAWTGAIELLETQSDNQVTPAAHPDTGRVYTFHGSVGTLRVTEAAWPAVPNSVGRETDHDLGAEGSISPRKPEPLVDPGTDRVFVHNFPMCLEEAEDGSCAEAEGGDENPPPHFRVFEDRVPDRPAPRVHPDYDQRTSDLSEKPGVATSTATGNAKAFGARLLSVGGTQNMAWTPFGSAESAVRDLPVGPAGRDAIRGQVIGANLSRISTPTVGALATGLHIADQQTSQDLQRNTDVQCLPSRTASQAEQEADCLSDDWQSDEPGEQEQELHRRWDGSSWPDEFPEEMRGRSAYCDDFGGEPSDDATTGSAVACDSAVPQVSAGALFSPSEENASAGGETPGLHVGYAESSTDIHEDETLGMVSTASAVARDVDLFGQISIGEVRTEATAVAHGRPGTASTELVREYRQVRIGDFSCGWQEDDPCDLYEVVHQINEQLGPRVVARVPAQDTFLNPEAGDEPDAQTGAARVSNGTPGGAKALVTLDPYAYQSGLTINNDNHSELPGLEITVYHDNDRTSRQILQLAAVELDATYQISPVPTWDPPDWGSGDGIGGDDGLSDPTGVGGAAARSIVPPPPFAHLSQDPPITSDDTPDDGTATTGDTGQGSGDVAGFEDGDAAVNQGEPPSLGTADGPAVSTGDGVPAPEVAPDASGEQPPVAQGEQPGSSGPGGLMLTRQRMGETVPLAVLWVLATLPFYLAVRRRRLTASTRT